MRGSSTSPASLDVCCMKKSLSIHVFPSRVHSLSNSASRSPAFHSFFCSVSSLKPSFVMISYSR